MPDMGKVFWSEHPRNMAAPRGHQNVAGSGNLIAFGADEAGQMCGVVETASGAFLAIRLNFLRRHEERLVEPEEERSATGQGQGESDIHREVSREQEREAVK